MITLRYSYQKLQSVEHRHVNLWYSKQLTEIWCLKDCIFICISIYWPIKKQMFHNTTFLPHFHCKKKWFFLLLICLVWWLARKNIKNVKFLGLYFAYNSKSIHRKVSHLVRLIHWDVQYKFKFRFLRIMLAVLYQLLLQMMEMLGLWDRVEQVSSAGLG